MDWDVVRAQFSERFSNTATRNSHSQSAPAAAAEMCICPGRGHSRKFAGAYSGADWSHR